MAPTTFFNNGDPQLARDNGKMQPIILSDKDKICWCVWDIFWAPCLNACGMMPHVTGVPQDSKPISSEEREECLKRWEGAWDVQPLPSMAVRGHNKKFYVEYTTAHFDDGNVILSGGTHTETQVRQGTISSTFGPTHSVRTSVEVERANAGQVNKLIFFRSPDGKLYIDNVGSYVISEEPGKLKLMTAMGYPMVLRRDGSPEAAGPMKR